MKDQLKILKSENKGKGSAKGSTTADELHFLMDFNSSITQAAAKSMEHLSEFVFITMGNLTLVRRDAYLSHLRTGIKPDTLTAPLHISTLFPDSAIKRAEEDIAQFEAKGHSGSTHTKCWYDPCEHQDKRSVTKDSRSDKPAWKTIGRKQSKRGKDHTASYSSRPAKGQQSYKWQFLYDQVTDTTAGREHTTDNGHLYKIICKASCCFKCSYCARAFRKERIKSRVSRLLQRLQIKVCEKCFLCHSIILCSTCNKCQKFCLKSTCRGQTSKLPANLAGSGCRSESGSNPERGLHPPLSDPAKSHKVSHSHKLLSQSPQEQLPVGGITSAYRQKCSGASTKPNLFELFQPTIFSPKAKQQVETYTRSEQTKSFPQDGEIQNGDPENHQDIPPTRGVGHLNRLQGLPYPNTGTVQEISKISCPGSDVPIQSTSFWSVHSTLGVHCSSKGDKTDGHTQGYKNPPVPRRQVGEGYIPSGLSPAHSRSSENMPRTGLAGEFGKVRTGTKADLRFCRLPV